MSKTTKSLTAERIEYILGRLHHECKLGDWASFIGDMPVPPELLPAISSCRPELVCLARARPLGTEEVATLYKIIEVLIRTNAELRRHAALLAELTEQWMAPIYNTIRHAQQIRDFANFRNPGLDGNAGVGMEDDDVERGVSR